MFTILGAVVGLFIDLLIVFGLAVLIVSLLFALIAKIVGFFTK